MKSIVRGGVMAGAALLLGGCGGFDGKQDDRPATNLGSVSAEVAADGPAKLGPPYVINGVTYTPADIPEYDDVGYASWNDGESAGLPTAIGETFDPASITAAHKTLPLPSYVEVTALDTGRTILVRVNDRGPMANDRLIQLSRGAAEQLGIGESVAAVRVRRTNPPAAEKAQLRGGGAVPERIPTPDSLLTILRTKLNALPIPAGRAASVAKAAPPGTPAPVTGASPAPSMESDRFIVEGPDARRTEKPVTKRAAPFKQETSVGGSTAAGGYVVQVAAFSNQGRANAAAKSIGGSVTRTGNLWRVRIGPFANESDARDALGKAKAKGFRDAVVMRDR